MNGACASLGDARKRDFVEDHLHPAFLPLSRGLWTRPPGRGKVLPPRSDLREGLTRLVGKMRARRKLRNSCRPPVDRTWREAAGRRVCSNSRSGNRLSSRLDGFARIEGSTARLTPCYAAAGGAHDGGLRASKVSGSVVSNVSRELPLPRRSFARAFSDAASSAVAPLRAMSRWRDVFEFGRGYSRCALMLAWRKPGSAF